MESLEDKENLQVIRSTIDRLHGEYAATHDINGYRVLDVAPEIYKGARQFFELATVETLDISDEYDPTYVVDLAECENTIPDERFELIFCTEVLEHTNDPFQCAKNLYRMLKKGGVLVVTTPFNFRIHNPLPDNWRFTEHGLRRLFNGLEFTDLKVQGVGTKRFLMPVQYVVIGIR